MRQSTKDYFDPIAEEFEAAKASGFDGYVSFDDMKDAWWGPEGTPRRDRQERRMRKQIQADVLSYRVTKHLGPVGVFWRSFLYEAPLSLRGAADALSSEYLGDFLFWNDPVTADYHQSWVSKVHFPRWLHYHVGPRRDCTHD